VGQRVEDGTSSRVVAAPQPGDTSGCPAEVVSSLLSRHAQASYRASLSALTAMF